MSDIRRTSIRFNLDNPLHQKAWEYLQIMDRGEFKSYTNAVVSALNDYFDRLYNDEDKEEQLAKRIAREVSGQLKTILSGYNSALELSVDDEEHGGFSNDIDWDFIGKG